MISLYKVADAAAAVLLMLIIPALWIFGIRQTVSDSLACREADEYINLICAKGYMDTEMEAAFENSLAACGNYELVISCSRQLYIPGEYGGQAFPYTEEIPAEELKTAIENTGRIVFRKGDLLWAELLCSGGMYRMSASGGSEDIYRASAAGSSGRRIIYFREGMVSGGAVSF